MSIALLVHLTAAMHRCTGRCPRLYPDGSDVRRPAACRPRPADLRFVPARQWTRRGMPDRVPQSLVSPVGLDDSDRRAGGERLLVVAWHLVAPRPRGASDFAFAHPERGLSPLVSRSSRRGRVSPCQAFAWRWLAGLFLVWRRDRSERWASCGICAARSVLGDTWPVDFASLDFLQPGRHTYACYTALALAGGAGLDEFFRRARVGPQAAVDRP